MEEHEGRHVHEVPRAAGVELETQQALEADHTQPADPAERHFDGPVPVDGDQGRHDVDANAVDRRSEAGEVALHRVTVDPFLAQTLASLRQRAPDHEVEVLCGAHVSVGAHGEAADEDALLGAQDTGHTRRRAKQVGFPQRRLFAFCRPA
jgi:hypothetical protein